MRETWEQVKKSWVFDNFYFFAIALILAFGTLQTSGAVLNTEKPVVTVISCSMYPQLDVGDVLLVQGKEFESYEESQVIVFSVPGQDESIVHRIIRIRQNSLETKGDNNNQQLEFEKNIQPEQVQGKVVFKAPKIGAVKLLTMDVLGIGGVNTERVNSPLSLENTYFCSSRV